MFKLSVPIVMRPLNIVKFEYFQRGKIGQQFMASFCIIESGATIYMLQSGK